MSSAGLSCAKPPLEAIDTDTTSTRHPENLPSGDSFCGVASPSDSSCFSDDRRLTSRSPAETSSFFRPGHPV